MIMNLILLFVFMLTHNTVYMVTSNTEGERDQKAFWKEFISKEYWKKVNKPPSFKPESLNTIDGRIISTKQRKISSEEILNESFKGVKHAITDSRQRTHDSEESLAKKDYPLPRLSDGESEISTTGGGQLKSKDSIKINNSSEENYSESNNLISSNSTPIDVSEGNWSKGDNPKSTGLEVEGSIVMGGKVPTNSNPLGTAYGSIVLTDRKKSGNQENILHRKNDSTLSNTVPSRNVFGTIISPNQQEKSMLKENLTAVNNSSPKNKVPLGSVFGTIISTKQQGKSMLKENLTDVNNSSPKDTVPSNSVVGRIISTDQQGKSMLENVTDVNNSSSKDRKLKGAALGKITSIKVSQSSLHKTDDGLGPASSKNKKSKKVTLGKITKVKISQSRLHKTDSGHGDLVENNHKNVSDQHKHRFVARISLFQLFSLMNMTVKDILRFHKIARNRAKLILQEANSDSQNYQNVQHNGRRVKSLAEKILRTLYKNTYRATESALYGVLSNVTHSWSAWSTCSVTCGQSGHRQRVLSIQVGGNTVYADTNKGPCEPIHKCPVSVQWTEWGVWSPCNVTCSPSYTTRKRYCVFKSVIVKVCQNTQVKMCSNTTCSEDKMPTTVTQDLSATSESASTARGTTLTTTTTQSLVQGKWSSWKKWSSCSVTCGLGSEVRRRECSSRSGASTSGQFLCSTGATEQTRPCILSACNKDSIASIAQKVVQGIDTVLRCLYDKLETPKHVYWITPNGKKITPSSKSERYRLESDTLIVYQTQWSDRGMYHCVVEKENLHEVTADAMIEVMTCRSDVCLNGGTCVEKNRHGLYHTKCLCPKGYIGQFCQKKLSNHVLFLLIGVISAVVIILACLAVICWQCRNKKKDKTDVTKYHETKTEQIFTKDDVDSQKKLLNSSVVSNDDSFIEIGEKDFDNFSEINKELINSDRTRDSEKRLNQSVEGKDSIPPSYPVGKRSVSFQDEICIDLLNGMDYEEPVQQYTSSYGNNGDYVTHHMYGTDVDDSVILGHGDQHMYSTDRGNSVISGQGQTQHMYVADVDDSLISSQGDRHMYSRDRGDSMISGQGQTQHMYGTDVDNSVISGHDDRHMYSRDRGDSMISGHSKIQHLYGTDVKDSVISGQGDRQLYQAVTDNQDNYVYHQFTDKEISGTSFPASNHMAGYYEDTDPYTGSEILCIDLIDQQTQDQNMTSTPIKAKKMMNDDAMGLTEKVSSIHSSQPVIDSYHHGYRNHSYEGRPDDKLDMLYPLRTTLMESFKAEPTYENHELDDNTESKITTSSICEDYGNHSYVGHPDDKMDMLYPLRTTFMESFKQEPVHKNDETNDNTESMMTTSSFLQSQYFKESNPDDTFETHENVEIIHRVTYRPDDEDEWQLHSPRVNKIMSTKDDICNMEYNFQKDQNSFRVKRDISGGKTDVGDMAQGYEQDQNNSQLTAQYGGAWDEGQECQREQNIGHWKIEYDGDRDEEKVCQRDQNMGQWTTQYDDVNKRHENQKDHDNSQLSRKSRVIERKHKYGKDRNNLKWTKEYGDDSILHHEKKCHRHRTKHGDRENVEWTNLHAIVKEVEQADLWQSNGQLMKNSDVVQSDKETKVKEQSNGQLRRSIDVVQHDKETKVKVLKTLGNTENSTCCDENSLNEESQKSAKTLSSTKGSENLCTEFNIQKEKFSIEIENYNSDNSYENDNIMTSENSIHTLTLTSTPYPFLSNQETVNGDVENISSIRKGCSTLNESSLESLPNIDDSNYYTDPDITIPQITRTDTENLSNYEGNSECVYLRQQESDCVENNDKEVECDVHTVDSPPEMTKTSEQQTIEDTKNTTQ